MPLVDTEYVRHFLERAFSTDTTSIHPIRGRGGINSAAFSFSTSTRGYVVRFSNRFDGFERDDYAFKHFFRRDVPIPETYALGTADKGLYYSITATASGKVLKELPGSSRRDALPSLLHAIDSIHQIGVDPQGPYGQLDSAGSAPHSSWMDYLLADFDKLSASFRDADGGPNSIDADYILDSFLSLVTVCPNMRTLIHGDLSISNVFVDDDLRVSSIIDWAHCKYGDPLYDLAWIAFFGLAYGEFVLDCYKQKHSSTPFLNERLRCYWIHMGLTSSYFWRARDDLDRCRQRRDRLYHLFQRDE